MAEIRSPSRDVTFFGLGIDSKVSPKNRLQFKSSVECLLRRIPFRVIWPLLSFVCDRATDPISEAICFEMLDVKPYIGSEDHVGRPAPITNFPMLLTSGIVLSTFPFVFFALLTKSFLSSDLTESTYKSAWTSPTASQASGKFILNFVLFYSFTN